MQVSYSQISVKNSISPVLPLSPLLFYIWAFPDLFWGFFFLCLIHWYDIINLNTMFLNETGKKKEEYVALFITCSLRDSPMPSKKRLIAFSKKCLVHPGIWTPLTQTECHCPTACATATTFAISVLLSPSLSSLFCSCLYFLLLYLYYLFPFLSSVFQE